MQKETFDEFFCYFSKPKFQKLDQFIGNLAKTCREKSLYLRVFVVTTQLQKDEHGHFVPVFASITVIIIIIAVLGFWVL